MNYSLIFHLDRDEFAARNDPQRQAAYWGAFLPYLQSLKDAGVFVGGAGLQGPESATTVRAGDPRVHDGPFAEAKEQLGGFIIINVPDLDAALMWARRYPASGTGGVEVRPNLEPVERRG